MTTRSFLREMTIEDVFICADLIYRCALETCKYRVPSYDDLIEDIASHFNYDIYWYCVYEEDGEILGVGGLMFIPYKWNRAHQRAIETGFHADPRLSKYKKAKICSAILREFEKQCVKRNVNTLTMGEVEGLNDMGNCLLNRGFELSEKHYIKEYAYE